MVGWGYNGFGQTTPPSGGLSNVIAIAAGYLHSAAVRSNGTVIAWGDNTYGQTNVPPGLSNVVAITAGDFQTVALRHDGSTVAWGDNSNGQTSVPAAVTNTVALASGNYHGLAMIPTISLQLQQTSVGMVITWQGSGTLQWSASLSGPFTDMSSHGNCVTNSNMSSPTKFFRLKR